MSEQVGKVLDWRSEPQSIAADHPSLPGHFPGRPVVPGVVLLDCVRAALAEQCPDCSISGFPNVKFLNPLLPEQPFSILLQGAAPKLRFAVEAADGRALVQGQISL